MDEMVKKRRVYTDLHTYKYVHKPHELSVDFI